MSEILISHRGNLVGPNPDLENNPDHITKNVLPKFNCEVDLRFDVEKHKFYLGHDFNQYPIEFAWLEENSEKLWIHCKDFFALNHLMNITSDLNYFWHENDEYTLTSKGYIWTYPGKNLSNESICVLPEWHKEIKLDYKFKGICSDYIERYKNEYNKTNRI